MIQSLHKALPSTTLHYRACTKYVPVLLCTSKLAQTTSQYYVVLQSLHTVLPSATLYYKACRKHVPVLLCTTKLAQTTSQYYVVLQSLHTVLPSATLYYKACRKHVPVLLCTTKLAQSTSQYYFVLQSLHTVLPSATLYYKACRKHVPVLLCSTKLAQSTSQYYFVLQSTSSVAFSHRSFDTQQTFTQRSFLIHNDSRIFRSKTGSRRQAPKKTRFWSTLKRIFLKGKTLVAKLQKTADKSLSQPWCNHSNTIYNVQLQKTIVLRTQPRQQATLTQSLHCDLQPQMQQAHRSTHTWATTRCRTPRENRFDDETSAAEPAAHTRYLASPAETTLITRKNTRFRAPASSANQSPCNIHAAITTRFHGNKTWHQSCSHYTAICNQRFNKRIEQSSSFVITLRHHFLRHHPWFPTFMWYIVMWYFVMWCIVTTSPPFVRSIVAWLSLLCDVKFMLCKVTWIKVIRNSEDWMKSPSSSSTHLRSGGSIAMQGWKKTM